MDLDSVVVTDTQDMPLCVVPLSAFQRLVGVGPFVSCGM